MVDESRAGKIDAYGAAHERLVAALARFPREMWQFRPAPDRWTIHEVVVHIADSEANSFVRARRLIAEPGSAVLGYDEEGWARALRYHEQSAEAALELFRWLRQSTYELIRGQPDGVWSHTIHHSESGPMTLDEWLDIYERHIPEHIAQMEGIHRDWQRQSGAG